MFSSKLFLALFFGFTISLAAQIPQPSATPPAPEDASVKITTSLIQLDVVVTDKSGKQIADLKPEDFLIYQDGKLQKITNLSYVNSITAEKTEISGPKQKRDKKESPSPPANVRSKQGRIITFVLDDGNCLATPDTIATIRDAMRKFIDEQMQPDDRIAIYRTRGGASLMQMYTSNREVLRSKLSKINLITAGNCNSAFDPIRDTSTIKYTGQGAASFESEADKQFKKDNAERERENQVIGTIGVMGFVVDRLRNVPQRKIVFLLSEGIIAKFDSRTNDALRELADKASRASVVINTMSAKGVTVPGMLSAQDEVLPGIRNGSDQTYQAVQDRVDEETALNQGISYLAFATGGKFVRNRNFLDTEIKKILDAETGYYLIGYEPDDETFKGKDFHKIEVKVNRPDLVVGSRKGFYGRTDKESQPVYKTADSPLFQAINSPFEETGMDIRLTTLLGNNALEGSYIRSLLHVKGQDLTFTDESNGDKKIVLDVVAVALDEKGKVVEEFNRTYPIRIPKQGVTTVQQNGLDFSTDISFKRPGIYTFRLAVRDNNSKRLGSAGDFVQIPDFSKDGFLVSGLITTGIDPSGKPVVPKMRPVNSSFAPVFAEFIPSIRRYRKGSVLSYAYTIYNARTISGSQPNLTRAFRLYHDGKVLVDVPEKPLDSLKISDGTRIEDFGILRLGDAMDVGEYVLQIIIRDKAANKTASQWIDFEVIQ